MRLKSDWWKLMCALILLVVVYFTIKAPLSPGLLGFDRYQLSAGEQELTIIGYNTHFTDAKDMQVWLEYEDWNYCIDDIHPIDDTHARISLVVPHRLPSNLLNVFVSNEIDGVLVSLNELWVKEVEINTSMMNPDCHRSVAQSPLGFTLPYRKILYETIRNLNLHVPMWFAMMVIMLISFIQSIRYLGTNDPVHDDKAQAAVRVGLLFALIGIATGSIWARFTWGAWWTDDKHLNGAAISVLIYLAYLLLRKSISDENKQARISAVYNIFAFVMFILFIQVIPRLGDATSLHPGRSGNPAFSNYDLDNKLRMLFYPAVIGWILLGYWIYRLRYRLLRLTRKRIQL